MRSTTSYELKEINGSKGSSVRVVKLLGAHVSETI